MPSKEQKRYKKDVEEQRGKVDEFLNKSYGAYDRAGDYSKYYQDLLAEDRTSRGKVLDPLFAELPGMMDRSKDIYGFANTLMGKSKGIEDLATSDIDLGNVTGYRPETLAALKGQAIDRGGSQFSDAVARAKIAATRGGGGGAVGGTYIPGYAGMLSRAEQDKADALRDVTTGDEATYLKNLESARKYGLAKRDLALGGLASGADVYNKGIGRYGEGIGYGMDVFNKGANAAIAAYDPSTYSTGLTRTLDTANNALSIAGSGLKTRGEAIAQPQEHQSFWKSLLGAGAGIGLGFLTGGLSGLATGAGFLRGGGAALGSMAGLGGRGGGGG